MSTAIEIKADRRYWVHLDGIRLNVRVVEPLPDIPGWWKCVAPMGTEIMAEETSFVAPADSGQSISP